MAQAIFRITSAGSVDDGKSTVLARLLLDTQSIYDDQLTRNFDPSRIADLLDGLESEQSQGITIDVAHRFFDSGTRRYHIADSPGHEQYTRNMATACAGSDALLLVVDATKGIKKQTKHHLEIALRLGIRNVIVAVNKMDLVNYSARQFENVKQELQDHITARCEHFEGTRYFTVPISGLRGDNVVKTSRRLGWFAGMSLLETLDSLKVRAKDKDHTIVSIQCIQRISGGGRRYLGILRVGTLRENQNLFLGHDRVTVKKLFAAGTQVAEAKAGSAISIEIEQEMDFHAGEILSSEPIAPQKQFEADIIWLGQNDGLKGRRYLLQAGSARVGASMTKIFSLDLDTNKKKGELSTISRNQIIRANINLNRELPLLPFQENYHLGRFILISPESGQTLAVGLVNFSLRRSKNISMHEPAVSAESHATLTGTVPKVIWFTGLSGSGKSTTANELSKLLFERGLPHYVLDGDNLRFGLNADLGFTESDRTENIRRTAEVAKLMMNAGLIVLVALISPTNIDRRMAQEIIGDLAFQLVYIDTPLEICESRDPKGLYKKARSGEIPNFTGVSAEFDAPDDPKAITVSNDWDAKRLARALALL